jgi:hypothetical protein
MLRLLLTAASVAAASDDGGLTLSTDALQSADTAARGFWEGANPSFAFLDMGKATDPRTAGMMRGWQASFLGRYDWTNRAVIDYGAASGLLGEWLLQSGGASHYVAVDIAERAVKAAHQRLRGAGYHDGRRGKFEAVQAPVELCTLSSTRDAQAHPPPADTLVSTKTLQHFASIEMLAGFFRNVRHSGIETVMLQLVEGEENSCYGTVEQYATQSGPDSIIARLGHWCEQLTPPAVWCIPRPALISLTLTEAFGCALGAGSRLSLCSVSLLAAPVRRWSEGARPTVWRATSWSGRTARASLSPRPT